MGGILPSSVYDEDQVNLTRIKMQRLEFTSRVDDVIKMFTYVVPSKAKLIRYTKVYQEHKSHLSCIECESVLAPHP